jgi:hypothetical protein
MEVMDADANANADRDAEDEAKLAAYAVRLADGVEESLPGWVVRSVEKVMLAWSGEVPEPVMDEARAAGAAAREDIGPRVRELLLADIDDQPTNPLAIVRDAVRYPSHVLERAAVPPVVRDADAEAHFPDDAYDLVPASFADIHPSLHEPGLAWGAAKAHVHLRRRRAEGKR